MFESVRLVNRDNQFVEEVVIPRFNPPADVVLWGSRFFIYRDDENGQRTYREGMLWPVLDQALY